jgi:hypothetical protein
MVVVVVVVVKLRVRRKVTCDRVQNVLRGRYPS